tara:strand:+ start:176 stop:397 length:222 start_codon:yes stop_codon:yes gene_type:complete
MDLTDERLHRKRVPWDELAKEGVDPRKVMLEAQKQGMHLLARRANNRMVNEERKRLMNTAEVEAVLRVRRDVL